MIVSVYLIAAPGMDRVCVQTTPPTTLQRKPGVKVYRANFELPEVVKIDGVITTTSLIDETEPLPAGEPAV